MSDRRYSINDIKLPPTVVKGLSVQTLKEISKQDEATFYQWFEGLDLEEVGHNINPKSLWFYSNLAASWLNYHSPFVQNLCRR